MVPKTDDADVSIRAAAFSCTLACFAEAAERMLEPQFLIEHAAAHAAPRTPAADLVASVLEREWWHRWPVGRGE